MHKRFYNERIIRFYNSDHSNLHEWNSQSIAMHKCFNYERIVRFYNSDHSDHHQ